ncbi:NCS1 family nucleobase:cation symporter-1 [Arthrobacter sp. PvP102]|uniref:purine-cytosine permease family protein n=1 Tax=unclassified Arthrobacter TaxID=235627 RepID=UPI001AE6AE79|nr:MULTISPECIES: cytosine permease [unclassified Arthrobacter]MBP1233022.1 NCS1 family nucleobase:cation symporter-1 [Arthrobacter sp. PvP103]MBP1238157.1 NCS1 family nucleobase:cation symporter-1 [Arthrobacter sp. PvP102]
MSPTDTPATEVPRLEDKTIQPIPANERHGKARDLFTIWFGSNIMIMTIVTGGLATTVFGLGFVPAIVGIIIGNVVGGIFMALHSAQGPQLGVAQMIQTRGQFGSFGALLIVVIVVVMYVGFFAANLVFGGEAMAAVSPGISVDAGIIIIGVVSVIATIFGYRLIHAYARILSVAAGLALLLAFGWILVVHGLPASFLEQGNFNWVGFMGTISVSALWQLAYAPYVSDYSRYMPHGTGSGPAFWASYSGCVLGTLFPMILGALVGTLAMTLSAGDVEIVGSLGALLQPWTLIIVGIFCLGVAASNAMNLYCGVLCILTIGQTFRPTWLPRAKTRSIAAVIVFVVAVSIALFARDNFILFYTNFLSFLMYVLVPWTAINLVDYYLLRHGDYRVEDFFKRDGGVYGRFNWVAIGSYLAGALIQVPFSATAVYTGPLAAAMGGVDISWIVGLAVVAPLYYVAARVFRQKTEPAAVPSPALTPDLI